MRVLSFAVLAFLVIWPRLCHSARILMLSPVATKSHKISVMPVLQALAQQGHLVTILTSHQPEESVKNVHEIVVHNPYMNDGKFDWFTLNSVNPLLLQYYILNNFATVSKFNYEAMMNNTEFKSLLRKREVDLVILDDSFNDFCLKVIEDLQVPFIFFSSSTGYPWVFSAMGATQELSSVPSRFTGYDNDMSFKERLFNTLAGLGALWLRTLIVVPAIDDYTKKDFPKARSISEIEKDASLYFLSCQWTTTWPRPLPPTVILLGPLHIHSPRPLPREIENMIGKSEDNGCIIFTLGSIPSSKFMPEKHIQTFVKVFSMIPQQVIWKWDDSTHIPDNVSENVHLVNWLPQQDLLGNPNVRLFMTHGGLLGMQEALYHSVPLLALPFGTDQYLNAAKMRKEGCGLRLDWNDLDEMTLYNSITTIINDLSYKRNATRLSRLMRAELVSGQDVAVYWIEHVLRFNGTTHLKLNSQNIPFYQLYLLDIGLFLATTFFLLLCIAVTLVRNLIRCLLMTTRATPAVNAPLNPNLKKTR